MAKPGILLIGAFLLCLMACRAVAEEGLVACYDFEEGSGSVVRDKSGNGNHGTIHGAKFVDRGRGCVLSGHALQFDGVDDYVDFETKATLDCADAVTLEAWVFPQLPKTPLGRTRIAGTERNSYLLFYYDFNGRGCVFWHFTERNYLRALADPGAWHHIAGTFDGEKVRLFIDGRLRDERTFKDGDYARDKPFRLGVKSADKGIGIHPDDASFTCAFEGMIDEVRVYARALSEAEIADHYKRNVPFRDVAAATEIMTYAQQVIVGLDLRGLGELPDGAVAEVRVTRKGKRSGLRKHFDNLRAWDRMEAVFDATELEAGEYAAQVTVSDKAGAILAKSPVSRFQWPERAPEKDKGGPKVLNNFVSELLKVKRPGRSRYMDYEFENPRDGWILVSSAAKTEADGKIWLSLDSASREEAIIIHDEHRASGEAMRLLSQGGHKVRAWREGESFLDSLVVRRIPELSIVNFLNNPRIRGFGPYDIAFFERYIVPNLNCMSGGVPKNHWEKRARPFAEQWKAQGKRWIKEEQATPYFKGLSPEESFNYWINTAAVKDPIYDGILADEYGDHPKYEATTQSLKKLFRDERFKGKFFHPYCGPMYVSDESKAFINTVIGSGANFFWSVYLKEPYSSGEAARIINRMLIAKARRWKQDIPESIERMVISFGHFLSATPETFNSKPWCDYKVFMDLQFAALANDPVFRGVAGVNEYKLAYADDEYVRWAMRLYRHYCIEGNRGLLSKRYGYAFRLRHIHNPDFDEGLTSWVVEPATKGTVQVKRHGAFGRLQGRWRFGRGDFISEEGNNFLWMKRSLKRPNVVTQQITNLQPGKLYSLKMITGDYEDLLRGRSRKQKHAMRITIENVQLVPERCFQSDCFSPHEWRFRGQPHPYRMNYHQVVFKAMGKTAKLAVSDWRSNPSTGSGQAAPGGPMGQELVCNFIEVQPYFDE